MLFSVHVSVCLGQCVCLTVCMSGFKFIELFVFESLCVNLCLCLSSCLGFISEDTVCVCLILICLLATLCVRVPVSVFPSVCLHRCACR